MPAGNAYPSGHLVPSPFLGLANAPIVETIFLELAMSLLDFSPRIPLGTFSILPSGRSENTDVRLGLLLAQTFMTSALKPQKGIQRNFVESKSSISSAMYMFSGRSKTKMAAQAFDWLRHYSFAS